MSLVRQGWRNARVASSNARLVHTFLPEDPDEAYHALVGIGLRHQGSRHLAADIGEYDHARLADIVAQDGFSHHPTHGAAPKTGWMASYHAPDGSGIGQVHGFSQITPDHIAAHREAIGHHLAKQDSYQGGWHDKETGQVYLDASRHFNDEHSVKNFAVEQKQKAVFHLGDFTERFLDPHHDPLREKDHNAWKERYNHNTAPHPGFESFRHLYPDTDEQAAARGPGQKSASKMAGRVAHPGQSINRDRDGWVARLNDRRGGRS